MKKVPFGQTGERVSQICLGTMWMGTQTDQEKSFALLDYFVEKGGNFLDTANCYAWWAGSGEFVGDESERVLGEWMRQRGNREQIFLATKVGARLKDPARIRDADGNILWDRREEEFEYLSPAVIRKGIEGSLRRLGTDHVDLYYAHIDDRHTPLEDTLEALNRLVEAGKVRYVGCSNFRTWRLERARRISDVNGWASYTAIQQQYSYFRPKPGADFGIAAHADDELLNYLRANEEVAFLAYSPLLKGIYDDEEKRKQYYDWPLFDTQENLARLEVLTEMAKSLGLSNHQLVLAWLAHHQPRVIPILGASSVEQLDHNLQALSIELTADQMNRLDNAGL